MFKIEVVAIGRLYKEFLKSGEGEYLRRISPYYDLKIVELPEEKEKGTHEGDILRTITTEGQSILKYLEKQKLPVFALAIEGTAVSSESFAKLLSDSALTVSGCIFVIGGSNGLSETVKQRANRLISFSDLTFPHQLMRVILLEQIYRAATINNGITYHK
jgi:23S rRNA (pseudouridine1915-N3)-methyltransferase